MTGIPLDVLDRHSIVDPPAGVERIPGDFKRGKKKTPYIAHPTDRVKSGARKEIGRAHV